MKSRSKNRNCCWKRPDTVSVTSPKPLVPCTFAVSCRYSTPKVLVLHVPTWKWFSHSTSRRSASNVPGKSQGGPNVAGGHANGSAGSMNAVLFQYRPRRNSLPHHETGRVCAVRPSVHVSLSCFVFGSIVGTIGAGVPTNSMGSPTFVWFQRVARLTVVWPGSDSPKRALTESWLRPSLVNCPFDSRCDSPRE